MTNRIRHFLPEYRTGIAIDIIAIVANLFLFPLLLSRVGDLFDGSFADDRSSFITLGGLMVLILAGRLFGLYLKRFSLQQRLEQSEQTYFPVYFFLLNVGVFVLNSAFVVVFIGSLAAATGIVETTYSGQPKESFGLAIYGVISMLALMSGEIYLLWRLSKPLTEGEKQLRLEGNWKYGRIGETIADLGLFAYMMVWQVFYNDTAKLFMTPPNPTDDTGMLVGSTIFLFIVFLIFYVSPRTVFLIEDRKYPGTWLFIFCVFLSSILRYL